MPAWSRARDLSDRRSLVPDWPKFPRNFLTVRKSSSEDDIASHEAENNALDIASERAKGRTPAGGNHAIDRDRQKLTHWSRSDLRVSDSSLHADGREGRPGRGGRGSTRERYEPKSESEEEFDEAGADITVREVPNTTSSRSRSKEGGAGRRRRGNDVEGVANKGSGSAGSRGGGKGGNGPTSPVDCCVSDASRGSDGEDICDTEDELGDVPHDRVSRKGGRLREKRDGGGVNVAGNGRVDLVGSKRSATLSIPRRSNLSKSASAADVTNETEEGSSGRGFSLGDPGMRRTVESSSKHKARRNILAQTDESGWIMKTQPTDPVSAFRASQSAMRKNRERNMKQKTLTFRPVESAGSRRGRRAESSDEDIEEVL